MDDSWREIEDPQDLADLLGIELPDGATDLLDRIGGHPEARAWWRSHTEVPRTQYINGQPVLGLQILRTRYFFNVTQARKLKGDLWVIGAVYLYTGDAPTAGIVGAGKKVLDNLLHLTEDETELVRVIIGIAGRRPYQTSVLEDRVRAAYRDATVSVDSLFDSIEAKGIISKERGGKIRLVR